MPLKQRQKEILKEEYRNGEWYANDIRRCIPETFKADCWFDSHVRTYPLENKSDFQKPFKPVFRVMYLVGQLEEENKPTENIPPKQKP